jgi:hypothetical protein
MIQIDTNTPNARPADSTLQALLQSCETYHPETVREGDSLELVGVIQQSPRKGHLILLLPPRDALAAAKIELAVADVESFQVLIEDSRGRRTCRLRLQPGATLKLMLTTSDWPLGLVVNESRQEAREEEANTSEAFAAWDSAPWRRNERHDQEASPPRAGVPSEAGDTPQSHYQSSYPSEQYQYAQPWQQQSASGSVVMEEQPNHGAQGTYQHSLTAQMYYGQW